MTGNDTIAAISTPSGRGGLGVVRISGPEALQIVKPLLRLSRPLAAGRARRALVIDPDDGAVLDEAIATFFAAPHSYTTEDTVEISCHGSPVLLAAVLQVCISKGARLAEPGEFTRRAFLSGRLDLTEAEAVHDLVDSTTLAQARLAAAQLGGSVSRAVAPTRAALVALVAELEAGVDFIEDDLDLLPHTLLLSRLAEAASDIERLLATFQFGRVLHEGLTLAVVGRPNAGKSSLFNRLLGQERAIVTSLPGTTRDPIVETFALNGIPVRLVDTAGLRSLPDTPEREPERLGIERTRQHLAEADLILLVEDVSPNAANAPDPEAAMLREMLDGRPFLRVGSKADLLPTMPTGPDAGSALEPLLLTSAVTGQGIDELGKSIVRAVTGGAETHTDSAVITSARQHSALAAALHCLRAAEKAALEHLPHELLLLDLYAALEALDTLTGVPDRDEVLHCIFSAFCIGK